MRTIFLCSGPVDEGVWRATSWTVSWGCRFPLSIRWPAAMRSRPWTVRLFLFAAAPRAAHNEKLKKQAQEASKQADKELDETKADLDKLYADWAARKKRNQEENIKEEKAFLADRDAASGATGKFANVGRYVDLKGLEAATGEKDVNRMREVLLARVKAAGAK